MTRRSVSATARVAIFTRENGMCHLCGMRVDAGQEWDVSHEIPLALGGDDHGENLRVAHRRCHRVHTAENDVPAIARAKRVEARHLGAKVSRTPMPFGKRSPLKKRMDGSVVRREAKP